MSQTESLDNVLRAAYNAVLEAQKLTEQQHMRQLQRYFEEGKPLLEKLQVPDLQTTTPDDWREIDVPKLALIPPTALKINDLKLQFGINLIGFQGESSEKPCFKATPNDKSSHRGPIQCEFGREGSQGNPAQIEVTIESASPPEAYLRILDLLTSTVT